MAGTKHTAGPWKANGGQVEGPNMALVIATAAPIGIGYAPKDDAERKANARLIAAAPDMLAACKAALATHGCEKSEPGLPTLREVEDMLRSAIAKVEGSSHA